MDLYSLIEFKYVVLLFLLILFIVALVKNNKRLMFITIVLLQLRIIAINCFAGFYARDLVWQRSKQGIPSSEEFNDGLFYFVDFIEKDNFYILPLSVMIFLLCLRGFKDYKKLED